MQSTAGGIGCLIPSTGALAEPAAIRDIAQAAEGLGYDSVWVVDHVVIPAEISSRCPYNDTGEFASTGSTPKRRSKNRCGRWTRSCSRERPATSACRNTRPGR